MVRRSAAVSVLALSVATLSACAAAPDAPKTTLAAASPMVVAAAQPPRVAPTPVAKPEDDAAFYGFLQNFRSQALAAGVSAATYDAATGGIAPNARIKQLNESQPEFVRPVWDYLSGAVSELRVARGRTQISANGATLADIEVRNGVSREIVGAIWGIETSYGDNLGGFKLFEALANLAYAGPRQEYGRREMIAAMKLAEGEHLDPQTMTGSWAGAVGQTQFIPSTYLARAVDGDGDGRRDLWHSAADALGSTANYLKQSGWKSGESWGEEIRLPERFPLEQADPDMRRRVSDWTAMGVRTITGGELVQPDAQAAIFLPAGVRGPAFLLRDNFSVILKYNNATSYALAVGLLSDRLRGADGVIGTWPRDELPMTVMDAIALQDGLTALGFNTGGTDGIMGRLTRAAVRAYQKARNIPADGFATHALLDLVNAERLQKGV